MPFQDGAIELRKPTSAIHFTAPCGMQFSFGAKFTQPKKETETWIKYIILMRYLAVQM